MLARICAGRQMSSMRGKSSNRRHNRRIQQDIQSTALIIQELHRVRFGLDTIVRELQRMNTKVETYIANVSLSNELEVVETVRQHFEATREGSVLGVAVNHKILKIPSPVKSGGNMCELDGLLALNDNQGFAVVEVKSSVRNESIDQLLNSCAIVKEVYGGPVHAFLGGPVFPDDLKADCLRRGVGIVELSGRRYRVVTESKKGAHNCGVEPDAKQSCI